MSSFADLIFEILFDGLWYRNGRWVLLALIGVAVLIGFAFYFHFAR